ncbi:MAG: hypothetical protein LWX56_01670 [Ignavibacteria bacterium]|nr:hypothetical protein [Ignavibacteria bacterium]
MKKYSWFIIGLLFVVFLSQQSVLAQAQYASFGYFYDRLEPYGQWIELDHGVTAWHPSHVPMNWSPYTKGTWLWTNSGWYWDSYEEFGDIVYHYGRWHYDEYYGWLWVPDYDWAPAWVEWRYDDGYIGWAPLPPYASFSIRTGLIFSINFVIPLGHYHFVPIRYFGHSGMAHYYLASGYCEAIYRRSHIEHGYRYDNGRVFNSGIDYRLIERQTNYRFRERTISFTERDITRERAIVSDRDRITVSVPSRIREVNTKDVTIRRGERSSSLDAAHITMGQRTRVNNDTQRDASRENGVTGRTTTPGQRDVNVRRDDQSTQQRERSVRTEQPSAPATRQAPEVRQTPEVRQAPEARRENREQRQAPAPEQRQRTVEPRKADRNENRSSERETRKENKSGAEKNDNRGREREERR